MNAMTRVAQPNPIRGSSCVKIIGYKTPPDIFLASTK